MRSNRGFALILTLVITALLVALLTEFTRNVYVGASRHRNFRDGEQGALLAESGVEVAVKGIANLSMLRKLTGGGDYTSLLDPWARPQHFEDERGTLDIAVEEETGKIDLNSLLLPNGVEKRRMYEVLKSLLVQQKLPADLVDTVCDWTDADTMPRPGGAESSWYRAQKVPYSAKDAPLDTLDELRLVKGWTPEVMTLLGHCLTVYPRDPGATDIYRVNINTAPLAVIQALDPQMTESMARSIDEARRKKPFSSTGEVSALPGVGTVGTAIQSKIDVKGTIYRITATAKVGETTRTAEAVYDTGNGKYLYWREF